MGQAEIYETYESEHELKATAASNLTVDMLDLNDNNIRYRGSAFVGTPLQTYDNSVGFAYDSGQGFTAVSLDTCFSCSNAYYNQTASLSVTINPDDTKTELNWGREDLYTLIGYMVTDTLCLDTAETFCTPNAEFFVIQSAIGPADFEPMGFLGLAPNVVSNGPNLMGALLDSN